MFKGTHQTKQAYHHEVLLKKINKAIENLSNGELNEKVAAKIITEFKEILIKAINQKTKFIEFAEFYLDPSKPGSKNEIKFPKNKKIAFNTLEELGFAPQMREIDNCPKGFNAFSIRVFLGDTFF